MDMESMKAEAREAINDELRAWAESEGEVYAGSHDAWDAAVERIVARIESAATGTDPQPFAIGALVEHVELRVQGTIIDRREDAGVVHSLLVRWVNIGIADWLSPRQVVEVGR